MRFFRSIQGLRGIAATLVVGFHYGQLFFTLESYGVGTVPGLLKVGNIAELGAVAVPIFFVISGFVIGLYRCDPGPTALGHFVGKRLLRIVPLYWLLTVGFWATGMSPSGTANILASLGFVQQLAGGYPIIQPGWTLEYEMFFYLVFGLIVTGGLFGGRRRSMVVVALVLAGLVILAPMRSASANGLDDGPLLLNFLVGLLVAGIHRKRAVSRLWPLYLALAASLFLVTAVIVLNAATTRMASAGAAGLLVLGLVSAEVKGKPFLSANWLQGIGAASYSIYLLHMILVFTVLIVPLWQWKLQLLLEPHVAFGLLVLFAIACGWLLHRLVERPLIALLSRRPMIDREDTTA